VLAEEKLCETASNHEHDPLHEHNDHKTLGGRLWF